MFPPWFIYPFYFPLVLHTVALPLPKRKWCCAQLIIPKWKSNPEISSLSHTWANGGPYNPGSGVTRGRGLHWVQPHWRGGQMGNEK